MRKFEFKNSDVEEVNKPQFFGYVFYYAYKHAHFLKEYTNIEKILTKAYQLRHIMKDLNLGEKVIISSMWLIENKSPLVLKRCGPNINLGHLEFTLNRLTGLTAAFVFENRKRFKTISATEPLMLGLRWECNNEETSKLYLAAVSVCICTEHFYEQFLFWPLVCALKKLELKKITLEPDIKIANIKNKKGVTMGMDMMLHYIAARNLWNMFTSKTDFKVMLRQLPKKLKQPLNPYKPI